MTPFPSDEAATPLPLTPEQRAAYGRDGFLAPLRALAPAEALAERGALERLEARWAQPGALPRPLAKYLRAHAHLVFEQPLRIATAPAVLDRVESVLGPDILLWGGEYFIKEARSPGFVTWHQDLTYWGMDGSDHEITAWIALSAASPAAGCMRFVPGSHAQALVPHRDGFAEHNLLSRGQEIAVAVDEAAAVDAALEPGEMSLHHGRIFHASRPNATDDRRIGLVLRFIRPDTPTTGAAPDYAVLLRGVDRIGARRLVAPPPGDLTPARLALYEEVLAAKTALLGAGAAREMAIYAGGAGSEGARSGEM